MSRKIEPRASVDLTEEERQLRKTDCGKLLFTSYCGQNCALLIQGDRLVEALFFPKKPSKIGAIYIGKVKNMVKNIDACFVEIANGELCFLPGKSAATFQVLNRRQDGRILEGDELLVQVVRDAQKSKQASVTTQISLSNDYFVISMGAKKVCYSAKLSSKQKESLETLLLEHGISGPDGCLAQECRALLSEEESRKLRQDGAALDSYALPSTGMIVRTKAAESESPEELLRQFHELFAEYFQLLHYARYRSCFTCLKEAETEVASAIKQFTGSAEAKSFEVITDQKALYEQLKNDGQEKGIPWNLRFYADDMLPLSALYSLESKMKTALSSKVWLKSGGYLVIEPTEALTVIDVNSGKYESGKEAQDTYRKINLEAAEEVAFQLRLRNLSGIIIVDFINMRSRDDNNMLLQTLRKFVKQDRVNTTIVDMTPLGLVEITRKRTSRPLREQFAAYKYNCADHN